MGEALNASSTPAPPPSPLAERQETQPSPQQSPSCSHPFLRLSPCIHYQLEGLSVRPLAGAWTENLRPGQGPGAGALRTQDDVIMEGVVVRMSVC